MKIKRDAKKGVSWGSNIVNWGPKMKKTKWKKLRTSLEVSQKNPKVMMGTNLVAPMKDLKTPLANPKVIPTKSEASK